MRIKFRLPFRIGSLLQEHLRISQVELRAIEVEEFKLTLTILSLKILQLLILNMRNPTKADFQLTK